MTSTLSPYKVIHQCAVSGYFCEALELPAEEMRRGVVRHQSYKTDGAILEDTGLTARAFVIKTLWRGNNYANHAALLKDYRQKSAKCELVHPVYGPLKGMIESIGINHNPGETDSVTLDIAFIEDGKPANLNPEFVSVAQEIAAQAKKVAVDLTDEIAGKVPRLTIPDVGALLAGADQLATMATMGAVGLDHFANDLKAVATAPGRLAVAAMGAVASVSASAAGLMGAPASCLMAMRDAHMGLISSLRKANQTIGVVSAAPSEIIADTLAKAGVLELCFTAGKILDAASKNSDPKKGPGDSSGTPDPGFVAEIIRSSAKGLIEANRGGSSALAESVAIITKACEDLASGYAAWRSVTVANESNIYAVLLANGVTRHWATAVCDKNKIDNPNNVSGVVMIPERMF